MWAGFVVYFFINSNTVIRFCLSYSFYLFKIITFIFMFVPLTIFEITYTDMKILIFCMYYQFPRDEGWVYFLMFGRTNVCVGVCQRPEIWYTHCHRAYLKRCFICFFRKDAVSRGFSAYLHSCLVFCSPCCLVI